MVGIEAMSFHRPVYVGDLVSCHCRTERIGRTSIAVHVETWVRRARTGRPPAEIKVTEGMFTYVALDDGGAKRDHRRGRERRDGPPAQSRNRTEVTETKFLAWTEVRFHDDCSRAGAESRACRGPTRAWRELPGRPQSSS